MCKERERRCAGEKRKTGIVWVKCLDVICYSVEIKITEDLKGKNVWMLF
jgi:hypothetical protein